MVEGLRGRRDNVFVARTSPHIFVTSATPRDDGESASSMLVDSRVTNDTPNDALLMLYYSVPFKGNWFGVIDRIFDEASDLLYSARFGCENRHEV